MALCYANLEIIPTQPKGLTTVPLSRVFFAQFMTSKSIIGCYILVCKYTKKVWFFNDFRHMR